MRLTGVGHSWWGVQFYQENDGINFLNGASIIDLFAGDCTLEFWFRADAADFAYIFSKGNIGGTTGWRWLYNAGDISLLAEFATNDLLLSAPLDLGRWYHIALDWDVGTLTARLFVNGVHKGTDTAVGAYQSDAAENCIVNGLTAISVLDTKCRFGPIRLSNSRRYTGASFTPPQPPNWPANDANAQLITRMNDGTGATVTDYSGNGNNGTITFGATTRWYNDPNVRL